MQQTSLGDGAALSVGSKVAAAGYTVYTELPEKLRVNAMGQAEVDDFLWIMMIQWAKITGWHVTRSVRMFATVEKSHPVNKMRRTSAYGNTTTTAATTTASTGVNGVVSGLGNAAMVAVNSAVAAFSGGSRPMQQQQIATPAAAASSGAYHRYHILTNKAACRVLPLLPSSNLKSMVESIYRPGEGAWLADAQFYISSYLSRIALHRANLKVPALLRRPDSALLTNTNDDALPDSSRGSSNNNNNGSLSPRVNATNSRYTSSNNTTPPSKFSTEMLSMLKDCVLWDTNMLDDGYRNGLEFIHCANTSGNSDNNCDNSNSSSSNKTKDSPKYQDSAAAVTSPTARKPLMIPTLSSPDMAINTQPVVILVAFNPELSYAMARSVFAAYQGPIKSTLNKVQDEYFLNINNILLVVNTIFIIISICLCKIFK